MELFIYPEDRLIYLLIVKLFSLKPLYHLKQLTYNGTKI